MTLYSPASNISTFSWWSPTHHVDDLWCNEIWQSFFGQRRIHKRIEKKTRDVLWKHFLLASTVKRFTWSHWLPCLQADQSLRKYFAPRYDPITTRNVRLHIQDLSCVRLRQPLLTYGRAVHLDFTTHNIKGHGCSNDAFAVTDVSMNISTTYSPGFENLLTRPTIQPTLFRSKHTDRLFLRITSNHGDAYVLVRTKSRSPIRLIRSPRMLWMELFLLFAAVLREHIPIRWPFPPKVQILL